MICRLVYTVYMMLFYFYARLFMFMPFIFHACLPFEARLIDGRRELEFYAAFDT